MDAEKSKCTKCNEVKHKLRKLLGGSTENTFIIHIDIVSIRAKDKKYKKGKLLQFETLISCLRNTNGGLILTHLDKQGKSDKYLGHFDEFIGNSTGYRIEDGLPSAECFKRTWVSEEVQFSAEVPPDFLLVRVKKTESIYTVDFKTKIRSEFENERPTSLNIISVFHRGGSNNPEAVLKGINFPDNQVLHECKNIELKAFLPDEKKIKNLTKDAKQLVGYMWVDLKLRDNITSFAKLEKGGSYYVGISESKQEDRTLPYTTKVPEILGIELHPTVSTDDIEKHIKSKIHTEVSALSSDGRFGRAPQDLIKIGIHRCIDPRKIVIEVAVRCFDGIVFNDKDGPQAYKIEGGLIKRMSCEEWFSRLNFRCIQCTEHKRQAHSPSGNMFLHV